MSGKRILGVLGAVVLLSVAVVVTVMAGLNGRGPAALALCGDNVIAYATLPMPAPLLTEPATLRVGEARAIGSSRTGDPLRTWSPSLIGDVSLVRTDISIFPTHTRCGRVLDGYRYVVLIAVRPGELAVVTRSAAGQARTLRIQIVA